MEGFRAALAQYLIGDLEVSELETAIDESMAVGPEAGPELETLLDDLFQSGRLPHQIYALLKRRIEQGGSGSSPQGEERTQFQPPESPRPPTDEAAGGSGPADDATRIMPITAPGSATPNTTGTGRSGSSNVSGRPTTAGSNWSHPSQWTGGGPATGQAFEIGSVIKDRFVLEEVVGQGGMGKVFKALDLRKQEAEDRFPYVAVKVLNEDFKKHPQALQALQRESRKAQDLAHPNVVTVFDFDRDGDTVYMTMEFLEGESLDKFVKRHLLRGVAIDKAIEIVRSLGDGLAYAHAKSVVHSDFKPANAFLTASGVVKIFDFGIARAAKQPTDLEGEKTLFDAGELGALTPAYASCEMIEGGDPDPRDDVYALALVAYELMTGRHPFDKKSAVMARDSNMSAEPVKGLSRRQWRGIQRGLAFNREDRSASVEVFLDELNPRKLPVPIIAAAAVVIVAVSALLFIGLPGYLDDREVESLITDINDGPDETITARLMDLKNIQEQDASLFRDVFASPGVQQRFIEYYRRRIAAVWNPPDERFDFPRAEQLLAELQVFFSDSRAVSDLQGEIQEQRGEKIAELYTEVTSLLTAGVLIGEQADRNVLTVLSTLKQISPEDQRLSGEDIPIRFAEVATAQLQDGQLTLAERIVDQGLAFLPNDIGMLNVKDAINNQRDQVARAGRIGEFESILAQTGSSADAMTSPAVREAFIGLSSLDPGNRVVAETRQRIERSILSDLQGIQQQGNYADGYRLLQKVEGLASEQFLAAQTAELDAVAEQYLARIDTLFSELQIAVDSDRLDSGTGSATSILEQLDSLGVPTDRLIDARTQISAGYSRRAVRAQQSEQWDLARQHLRTGLAMDLPPNVRTRLEKELGDVDSYERITAETAAGDRARMLAEQREQEISRLRLDFDGTLSRPVFSAPDAREALVTIRSLADYDAPVTNGEQRVIERLVGAVDALITRDQFDEALTLTQQGSQIFPRNLEFDSLQTRIQSERANRAEALQRQELDDLETRIAGLLAEPLLDQSWDQSMNHALADYATMVGESARELSARRTAVAELYVRDARKQRENSRLVNAAQQLDRAERYAPQLAMLLDEKTALRSQEIALREQTAARAEEAGINNRKLALEAEAIAGNLEAAVRILNELRSTIPNDRFVSGKGPRVIASGYATLGLKAATKSNGIAAAAKLLRVARGFVATTETVPEIAELEGAIDDQARDVLDRVGGVMTGDQALNVKVIAGMVSSIRTAAPDTYRAMTPDIITSVLEKVQALADDQRTRAQRRLSEARAIFPKEKALLSFELGAVAAVAAVGDPCGRPELIGNGGRRGGSCRDDLPGDNRGPPLVVLPPGGPFVSAVAIGKYEITIRDYNIYCEQSGACKPRSGNSKLPLTEISIQEAEKFVNWLSEASGSKYRIPSSAEWEYAASANGQQPKKNFNCQVSQNNVLIKGISLQSVDTGEGNGWGLYNYVGNAQEWVRGDNNWKVRGGAYTNSMKQCDVSLGSSHSGRPDKITGFRIVRELG